MRFFRLFAVLAGLLLGGQLAAQEGCKDRFQVIGWPGIGSIGTELTLPDFKGGEVILTQADVIEAALSFDQNKRPAVTIRLSKDSAQAFGAYTGANIGEPIALVFDEKLLMAPIVRSAIYGGSAMLTGLDDVQHAEALAAALKQKTRCSPLTGS